MLMAVKNQLKVTRLSIKYAIMREMLNKVTFFSNIIFMILNNASMIVQWIILYGISDNIGDYTLKQVILLWGFASGTYGVSHFFFKKAYELSNIINTGKLDTILIQPKNVLISVITTDVTPSAIGDLIYGYIMLFIYGITLQNFLLFTFLIITGGLITTAFVVILGSLSFWFGRSDAIVDTGNSIIVTMATYPDGIFKGVVKILLYTIVPLGLVAYIPVNIMTIFNPLLLGCIVVYTILIIAFSFFIFNTGLKRYSSTNLMNARN
jgi:ABC-2 type transport system permease protein